MSPTIKKTLNPSWEYKFKHMIPGAHYREGDAITLKVFDYDKGMFDSDDPMGEVRTIALSGSLSLSRSPCSLSLKSLTHAPLSLSR